VRSERTGWRPASTNKLPTLGFLAVLFVIFSVSANNFFSVRGILNLLIQTSTFTIIGIGSTLVLMVGGIDLSLGALVALGGVGVIWSVVMGAPIWLAMIIGVGLGGLIGRVNAFLITRFRLPSFLATMSMAMIIYGFLSFLAFIAFNSPPPPHPIPESLGDLANKPVFRIYSQNAGAGARTVVFPGISWIVIIMVLVAVLMHFVSTKTRIGRYLRMVGSNQAAARLSGIKVNRVNWFAYTLAGMLAALSGVLLTSRLGFPPGGAVGYEMIGITCAMIGGASLVGGVGSMGGTVIGSFIVTTLATGLSMMNTNNPAFPSLFNGLVVLVAVYLDQIRTRGLRRHLESGPHR
jgi:ribose transport system permease protein